MSMRAVCVAALWLIPGSVVLGLALSAIFGAHGAGFVFVVGGLFGLIGATVHAMLSVIPSFERGSASRRIVVAFAGTYGISVPLWAAFGRPEATDFAAIGALVLALAALFDLIALTVERRAGS